MTRMFPVDRFEYYLSGAGTIEDDCGAFPVLGHPREDIARDAARQETSQQRFTILSLHDRAVAQDERQRGRKLVKDWTREVVAASRGQRHFHASVDGAGDGVAVRLRNVPVAVQDCAVNVEGEKTDHSREKGKGQGSIVPRPPCP
jgi:hypothetical protein